MSSDLRSIAARHRSALLLTALALTAACETERSSNPLSPNIAGPLPGVTITAPGTVGPIDSMLIASDTQPVTLTFSPAMSNSVRPFTYEVQVATDPEFVQIIVSLTGIEPNESGQIVVQLPESLEAEQAYSWRVRAVDGANTGPYSTAGTFEIFTPVTIAPPVISGPTGGEETGSHVVTLVAVNAEITGPAQEIRYRFELAGEPTFANPLAILTVHQAGGTTTSVSPGALPYAEQFYWRVRVSARARNGELVGEWSATASFRTPPAPVAITPPTPVAPINGATVSTQPTLTVANGPISGNPGIVTYQFEVDDSSSFSSPESSFSVTRSGTGTTSGLATVTLAAGQQFYWRVRGTNETVTSAWSPTATFLTETNAPPSPPPDGPAAPPAPDPGPGGMLPLPNMFSVVQQVAYEHPDALANSCQEQGGSWEFMDLVVARLRQTDGRWGYNCKRGNCGDVSQDVVDYHWDNGSANGSTEVYIIDIIGGHCGPNPSPAWIDQTQATAEAGTIGRWIFPR